MDERALSFPFKARYFVSGPVTSRTRQIWMAFHGYGQLGRFFIRKFESILSEEIVVVVPEGLSRFYLSELTEQGRKDNKVGATWMTSENRLMDIENYLTYLNRIHQTEVAPHKIPVTLIGFSQGCATVCRWAIQGDVEFQRLILWAGIFPPDMDFEKGHAVLENKKTFVVMGKSDPFINEERMAEYRTLAAKLGIKPEEISFDGKHEMNDDVLRKLAS